MASDVGMQFTHLGRSGVTVSRLCLGTMNFGWKTTEMDSFAIMDRAHEHGINFFDTANVYGGAIPPSGPRDGLTEQIIGRWFAKGSGRRERTVLGTKVYAPMSERPNESKLSALNIRRACDASLARLQTDYIDLYQMHHVDREAPWEEVWEAMEVLRFQGKILYVGSSNFAGWHIAKAQEAANRRNFFGLVSEQSYYNLFVRDIEREVLPAAQGYGLGVIPYSPLHAGLLAGVIGREPGPGRRFDDQGPEDILQHRRDQVEAYEELCKQIGEEPADVALAWLLTRPGVTAPIIGPRDRSQLDGSIRAVSLAAALDSETLGRLDKLFPPHQPAPEDYAW
ncbi:MAG TPA: aldo/keto reductase [Acidimicrobiales bacterium]|nr:aldo/keto reductase [Acidimicrobiales bacterium]